MSISRLFANLAGRCYECQLTIKQHRQEPVKITESPEKAWEIVSVDFSGPYPDGHYNLVVVDKRTRYPDVEMVYSTAFASKKGETEKDFCNVRYTYSVGDRQWAAFQLERFFRICDQRGV